MDTFTHQSVANWLVQSMKAAYPRAGIKVYDTHTRKPSQFISSNNLQSHIQDTFWRTFEIRVAVTGFVTLGGSGALVFAQMNRNKLRLGYLFMFILSCRVANPLATYLISREPMSAPLQSLLKTKGRSDILIYYKTRKETCNIVIGQWNEQTQEVDPTSKFPAGSLAMIEAYL